MPSKKQRLSGSSSTPTDSIGQSLRKWLGLENIEPSELWKWRHNLNRELATLEKMANNDILLDNFQTYLLQPAPVTCDESTKFHYRWESHLLRLCENCLKLNVAEPADMSKQWNPRTFETGLAKLLTSLNTARTIWSGRLLPSRDEQAKINVDLTPLFYIQLWAILRYRVDTKRLPACT